MAGSGAGDGLGAAAGASPDGEAWLGEDVVITATDVFVPSLQRSSATWWSGAPVAAQHPAHLGSVRPAAAGNREDADRFPCLL